jgi:hypothetical protein
MRERWLRGFVVGMMVSFSACAQNPMTNPPTAKPTGWQRVQGLGPHSKIRIKSDSRNAICFLHFADEQQLTCSPSESIGSSTLTFARSEIKSIKLSHWMVGELDDLMPGPYIYQR